MSNDIEKNKLKKDVVNGLAWKFLERIGVQGINFIIQIILARLLFPADYAVVALISVFIAVANIFVQSGFNTALIQKKEVEDADYSSVFYLSLVVAVLLYVVLYFTAPYIAEFYSMPILNDILRVQAIILIFGAINGIQQATLVKNMQFRKNFYTSMGGVTVTGIVGLTMAYGGFGVWALVFSQIANSLAITIILWFTVAWRPKLLFSFSRLKILFGFGWKLLCSSLLDTIYNNLRTLIIGKTFNGEILGYYNRGDNIPMYLISSINGSIGSVMFPAFSLCQEDTVRLKQLLRRTIKSSCFIIFPAMFGLAAVAKPFVVLILTEKWIEAVPFMQMCCIAYAFMPIHTANLQAINALGRSDIFLKLEIVKKFVGLAAIVISVPFGIHAFVGSAIMTSIIGTFINAWPNRKLLNYSPKEQWIDIFPYLLISMIMFALTVSIPFFIKNYISSFIIQITIGIIIYFSLAAMFKLEAFTYIFQNLKNIKRAKGR